VAFLGVVLLLPPLLTAAESAACVYLPPRTSDQESKHGAKFPAFSNTMSRNPKANRADEASGFDVNLSCRSCTICVQCTNACHCLDAINLKLTSKERQIHYPLGIVNQVFLGQLTSKLAAGSTLVSKARALISMNL
jgi:hypothetical protein